MTLSYISKPNAISSSKFQSSRSSLCPKDYRNLFSKSKISDTLLSDITNNQFQGQEIGSDAYMKKSNYRFLKTVNITPRFTIDENSIEYCKPTNSHHPQNGDILIVKDGAGDGLGEVCLYNLLNKGSNDGISAGILAININSEIRYYVLGLLKSKHFKDFINLNTPEGSTIRHSKKIALNYPIIYPSKKNNEQPDSIIEYVSIIVQNIVDKESQIREKTLRVDEIINFELSKNKPKQSKISLPKLNEIKSNQFRLDTGLYSENYKKVINEIENYSNGFFKINSLKHKWISGCTPEVFIENEKGNFWWIAVGDLSYGLYYKHIKKFILKSPVQNIVKDGDILITRKGATVGKLNLFFEQDKLLAFVNEDLKVLRIDTELLNKVFIGVFLNNNHGQTQLLSKGSKGTKQGLTNPNITDCIVPNFPDELKVRIAREYHNPLKPDQNLNLENYLTSEVSRNTQLGIFELNMEVLTLRNKLGIIIDKIIKEEKIDIEF